MEGSAVMRWETVCVVSGGLDSVVLGHMVRRDTNGPHLWLGFDYGQRHVRELEHADALATSLGVTWRVIDLRTVGALLGGDALTGAHAVPHGHYAHPSMAVTVVPNRNAIMLTIAYGIASAAGATLVATGIHAGDHWVYPDCRPEFAQAMMTMQTVALDGLHTPRLYTPFLHSSKADIVSLGARIGVPMHATWSCYEGGVWHCGRCGTCVERREAFDRAGVADHTKYQDIGGIA